MSWELKDEKWGPRLDDRRLRIRNWDLRIESWVFSHRELGFESSGLGLEKLARVGTNSCKLRIGS